MAIQDQDKTDIDVGFYEIDDQLFYLKENGDMYRLDFDINKEQKGVSSVRSSVPPTNYIEDNKDMELTESSQTKPDGSVAMFEHNVATCMKEDPSRDRETCSRMVRQKMKQKGVESTKTEDIQKDETKETKEPIKETKDVAKDTEDTKVEVCKEEYDFLKKQSEELEALKVEKKQADETIQSFKADFIELKNKVEAKEKAETEVKRQVVIKRITKDFDVTEEELKEDTIPELEKLEKRLDMAFKRNVDEEQPIYSQTTDTVSDKIKEITDNYLIEV